ncbi:hypothetical protein AAD001_13215 [Colwelliaceae bacterium 6471]
MNNIPILINNVKLQRCVETTKLSADIDGIDLWFDFPLAINVERRGEVFIAATLLEAMLTARDIHLCDELAISSMLMTNLNTLQDIYCAWNSALHKVKVVAPNISEPTKFCNEASFFSGGIDSSYTLAKHNDTISHLIFLKGFDEEQSENEWSNAIEKHSNLAKKLDKKLVAINSNIREFINAKKISNVFQHGLTLGSLASILGFSKVYIPSSFTYSYLAPWGSHSLTDRLWGNSNAQIIHDGLEAKRSCKTTFLYAHKLLLDNIQVCWASTEYNCGVCNKCVRTGLVLLLSKQKSKALPPLTNLKLLNVLAPSGERSLHDFHDLIEFSQQHNAPKVTIRLKSILWRYQVKYNLVELIKLLGGNYIKTWLHKLRKTQWSTARITMTTGNKNN